VNAISKQLKWALKGVLLLAAVGIGAQIVVIVTVWMSWGPLLFVLLTLPAGAVLAIVVAYLHDRDSGEPVGDKARRAISRMLAVLTLTVDMQLAGAATRVSWWTDALSHLPLFGGALATIVAMFAVRVTELGHARYLVPLAVAAPVAMMALTTREGWYLWLPMATALLLHAICMAFLQRAGIGARPPAQPSTPTT